MSSTRAPLAASTALLVICLLALWAWLPFIHSGLPFFYQEDEGHHHNRVVDMVKNGQWNPKYFRKPSLHFYLRMPVVAAAFLVDVKAGKLRTLEEIQSYDKFALGKYAYTTSHPDLVIANRLFSAALGLGVLALCYMLTFLLTRSPGASLGASLLLGLSPAFGENSSLVAVDIVMAFFVVAATFSAASLCRLFTVQRLIVTGILCGLAVSSKYNALPIMALPFLSCLVCRKLSPQAIAAALLAPVIGFFIGSPFILVELPLFLNQFAYEIWHYGIAGHEGNIANPGFEQIAHYSKWLFTDGPGGIALLGAAFGLLLSLRSNFKTSLLVGFFPIAYSLLMISQKANFVRNMIVVIPFVAIFAAVVVHWLLSRKERPAELLCFGAMLIFCIQPTYGMLQHRAAHTQQPDSRLVASQWLESSQNDPAHQRTTAVSGHLLLPRTALKLPGVANLDFTATPLSELFQKGFDQIVVGENRQAELLGINRFEPIKSFSGISEKQRVVVNPTIHIFDIQNAFSTAELSKVASEKNYSLLIRQNENEELVCETSYFDKVVPEEKEGHCWLTGRLTPALLNPSPPLANADKFKRIAFEAMTIWKDQVLSIETERGVSAFPIPLSPAWTEVSVALPDGFDRSGLRLSLISRVVKSPAENSPSKDARRLGVAVRNFRLLQ